MSVEVMPGLILRDEDLRVTYILASGPGGQNVNKVATAAQLRFDAAGSPVLSERVRTRLLEIAGSRATRDGEIVLTGRRFRTQQRNREDVIERLAVMIREAAHRQAFRVPTRPGKAARQRRMDGKSHRAGIKRNRKVRLDD
ncbi:translation peptide chain release factor Class I/peptidyl-tRNA hydrolase [Gluconobacter thailandicus F149-1 = NBRC 100600]|uniref:Aminoacyl-tRNA hydrolase n=2 Tax=Gluconobacter thailandicus TaxID=257438 RepID=A0AAJ0QPD8_GLUTH|nr:alternative ribosome rescue aminoacyl-tRNA hydrolase ArfB [Gluconobacter thailandicus]AFW02403.1 peptidyl-tRNA hydrolase domain-containing protein [Gluconobacter oxydans H24]ANQ42087.1 peptide chain release factor I [Gluconobacter oxydans]GAN90185.1 translation peptide chain release factor Class I/peptidyl-tRNA hydrolase [Gluconobacter frateurii M-2]KXV33896.1 peptide chain release factor I [Gluconobacter thailandicus]KXV52758.1 peptide chain release factor I [Gluconobacter thailandicus]